MILMLAVSLCIAAPAQTADESEFQSLLMQGFDLHRQARFAEAIPVLEHARRLEPNDYFANLLLGIDLLRTGKANEALPRFELAALARPQEETPEDYLGETHSSLGHYAQAAEAYHRALERSHNSEEALETWAGFALERFRQIGESLRASQAGVATVRRLQGTATTPATALACPEPIPALEQRLTVQLTPANKHLDKLSVCYAFEAGKAADWPRPARAQRRFNTLPPRSQPASPMKKARGTLSKRECFAIWDERMRRTTVYLHP